MQETTNLQLNTWAEDDPVSLEEMNENFTLLDAEAGSLRQRLTKSENAHELTAYHLTQRAMEAYHANRIGQRTRNLFLADFSKFADFSELVHLELSENRPVAATTGFSSAQLDFPENGSAVFQPFIRADSFVQIGSFYARQNGTVSTLTMHFSNGSNDMYIEAREDGVSVAQTDTFTKDDSDVPLAISFSVTAGRTYSFYLRKRADSSIAYQVTFYSNNKPVVSGTGLTYASGHALLKPFAVNSAGKLYLFADYYGTQPQIALSQSGGAFMPLSPVWTQSGRSFGDEDITTGLFMLNGVAAQSSQIKLTLPNSTASVEKIAAIVM